MDTHRRWVPPALKNWRDGPHGVSYVGGSFGTPGFTTVERVKRLYGPVVALVPSHWRGVVHGYTQGFGKQLTCSR